MKISIVVAVYNIESYLNQCLDSLINQTIKDIEIICVNDGSTDNSQNIINEYSKKDSRIKVINQDNKGISAARNAGIDAATGEYLLFIDGDDYIDLDLCEKCLNFINSKKVDTIFMGYYRKDKFNNIYTVLPKFKEEIIYEETIKNELIPSILGISIEKIYNWFDGNLLNEKNEFPSVWRFLYSKSIIKDNNIYFNKNVITGEDVLFNFEYLNYAKRLQISHMCMYYYVFRSKSLTNNYNQKYNFYKCKSLLVDERNKVLCKYKSKIDYRLFIEGTYILSAIQMSLVLSNCKVTEIKKMILLLKLYSNKKVIRESYKKLSLKNAPLKYKLPLFLSKYKFYAILFLGCYCLNKFDIHIYPDE